MKMNIQILEVLFFYSINDDRFGGFLTESSTFQPSRGFAYNHSRYDFLEIYISSFNGPDIQFINIYTEMLRSNSSSENDLSTSAVDGEISAAIFMIFVISWCIDMSLLSVHQSFSIISKL